LFALDAKTLQRIEPTIRRVIVADPQLASARLMLDLMKSIGAREVLTETDENRVIDLARDFEPGLLLTERTGPSLDGESLTRRIRRSTLGCRRMPIIMVTAEATVSTIRGARDSGVHEFLRKPFAAADLFRRVENVAVKPRPWIEAVGYVGPDRRRFNSGEYAGTRKRRADNVAALAGPEAVKDQALRILAASLNQFDNDPAQAARAVRQQAETLKGLAQKTGDAKLAVAAAGLDAYLASGQPTKAGLVEPINSILALGTPQADKGAQPAGLRAAG
jgi:two-component system, response regulator PdtaR